MSFLAALASTTPRMILDHRFLFGTVVGFGLVMIIGIVDGFGLVAGYEQVGRIGQAGFALVARPKPVVVIGIGLKALVLASTRVS